MESRMYTGNVALSLLGFSLSALCFIAGNLGQSTATPRLQTGNAHFRLWEVIHSDFYDGISNADIDIINGITLDESFERKEDESSFIMCADRKKIRSLGMTTASLKSNAERLLDTRLTIMPVNTGKLQAACFHTIVSYSNLDESGAIDYFEDIHGHPPGTKIHRSVIEMLKKGFIDKKYARLEIKMSTTTSITNPINDDEYAIQTIQSIKRALSGADRTQLISETYRYGTFATVRNHYSKSCPHLSTILLDEDINILNKGYAIIELDIFRKHGLLTCLCMFIENLALDHKILSMRVSGHTKTLNFEARGIVQSGTAFVEPFSDANLKGQGQIVAVADTGVDDLHCFFFDNTTDLVARTLIEESSSGITPDNNQRKIVSYAYTASSDKIDDEVGGHGTHVCGSVVGNCLTEGIYRDHVSAPEAKLAFYDLMKFGSESLSIFPNLTTIFNVAKDSGAYISSNSWGNEYTGPPSYDANCQHVDGYMYDNEEFLAVFAAGNDGNYGVNTVLSPAYSKNCISVGSAMIRTDPYDYQLLTQPTVSYFSSLGPTTDGRFGVDIVAPGEYIISSMAGEPSVQFDAVKNSNTAQMQNMSAISMQGTSMATPTTAGNLALIRQYFMDNTFWNSSCIRSDEFCKVFTPTGSLLKAVLLTSGKSMNQYSCYLYRTTIPWQYLDNSPNGFEGFGQFDLSNILPLKKENALENFELFVYDKLLVSENDVFKFTLTLDESLAVTLPYIKITIAWTDYPDQVGATNANLVNDIHLQVIVIDDISSTSVSMNYGNDNNPGGTISAPDTVNPVERVELQVVPGYSYEIYVIGATVTQSPQKVSLAMTYPVGGTVSGPDIASLTGSELTKEGPPPLNLQELDFGNDYCAYCLSLDFSFTENLDNTEKTLLASFDAIGDLTLVVFDFPSFNYIYSPLFTLIIESPNGLVGQIGGNSTWYYKTEGIYLRRWPLYTYNSWNRYVNGSQLSSESVNGTWKFYGMLGNYDNGVGNSEYEYSGTISLEIYDGIYRPPPDDTNTNKVMLADWSIVIISIIGTCLFVAIVWYGCFYKKARRGQLHNEQTINMSSMTRNQIHSNNNQVPNNVSSDPVFGRVVG